MDSIINALTSDDPKIREAAFETAAESTDASVFDRLIELVQAGTSGEGRTSTKGNVREAAAIAVGRSTNERAGSLLLELMTSEDPTLRSLAAIGLGQLQTAAAVSALISALSDSVNTVRNLAERGLLSMIDVVCNNGVEQLLELLNHPAPLTRSPAARVLGLTRDPRALDPLLQILRSDRQWLARLWAVKGLGDLAMTEAFDALAETIQSDEKNRVRAAAAEAIGKLRTPKSKALLQQALKDEDGGVRKVAEEALSALHQAGFEEDYDPFAED